MEAFELAHPTQSSKPYQREAQGEHQGDPQGSVPHCPMGPLYAHLVGVGSEGGHGDVGGAQEASEWSIAREKGVAKSRAQGTHGWGTRAQGSPQCPAITQGPHIAGQGHGGRGVTGEGRGHDRGDCPIPKEEGQEGSVKGSGGEGGRSHGINPPSPAPQPSKAYKRHQPTHPHTPSGHPERKKGCGCEAGGVHNYALELKGSQGAIEGSEGRGGYTLGLCE